MHTIKLITLIVVFCFYQLPVPAQATVLPGASQMSEYLPLITGKRVGLVINHTSLIGQTLLVDTLLSNGIDIVKIFNPEHGLRGMEEAGELFDNTIDTKTGIPLYSLYGSTKKPDTTVMKETEVMVFDLQDVGVRFFTYISTLYYVMEACAENHVPLIVLDRPNPNGDYVAGPVLDASLKSFVGIVPVPIVYGLTIGELAGMINGEKWLNDGSKCELTIIKIKNWDHTSNYELPVKPSPNLPNHQSVRLYPSLCLFEGTDVSIGRGTLFPFQVIGYPDPGFGPFKFTPESIAGMSTSPKHPGKTCYGIDLRHIQPPRFTLNYFMDFYALSTYKKHFLERPEWIKLLIGDPLFVDKVAAGADAVAIEKSWESGLDKYLQMRQHYLLYPDF